MGTNDEIQTVLSEIKALAPYEEGAKRMEADIREMREEKLIYLRSLLTRPESTTGDAVQDYVLRAFGVLDEGYGARVQALNKALKGRAGQPVLQYYFVGVPAWELDHNRMGIEQQSRFRCGILDGDELIIGTNPAECAFPMKRHAVENARGGKALADIEIADGPIVIPNTAIKNWESVLVFGREKVQASLKSHRRLLAEDAAFAAFLSSLGYVEMPSEPEQESTSA